MKQLYLHVGNPKTGTTAIQRFLYNNDDEILRSGIRYLKVGREHYKINHKAFHFSFLKEMGRNFKNNAAVFINSLDGYIEEVRNEISLSNEDAFIISFEGLSSLSMYADSKTLLERFLAGVRDLCRVEVVIYVRDPWEVLVSNYNERSKSKNFTPPFLDFVIGSPDVIFDQTYAYDFFVKIFGERSVSVKLFGVSKGRDFIIDFMDAIRPGWHSSGIRWDERSVNPSLAVAEIEKSRIRAVLDLGLDEVKTDKLLHGRADLNDDDLEVFKRRLDRINKNNKCFFKKRFNVVVDDISLGKVFSHERLFNSRFIREGFIKRKVCQAE